jgi:aryl-alcohol dehydrogenase-like predicted oxidoreductase
LKAAHSAGRAGDRTRSLQPAGQGIPHRKIDETTQFDKSDLRGRIPRFESKALKANLAVVEILRRIAERRGATPAQVALAWLLAQKPWIVPIPGTTKLTRLEENIDAAAVELSGDDLREIEDAKFTVQGARYPEELMRLSGR